MGGAGACAGADAADSSGKERDAWEAVTIVLRIATVGFSLASAIMTFTSTSTQCVYGNDGSPAAAGSVSYSDYGSFNYSAIASLVSAVLEGVVIWLEVLGKDEWAKTVEFFDKVVLALTSTSAPLLLAADNITSCGGRQSIKDPRIKKKLSKASEAGLGSLGSATAIQITAKLSERNSRKLPRRRNIIDTPPPIIMPPPPPCPSPPPPPCPEIPCSCSCPTVATPCCCENVGPWYPCSAPSS
ncbi:unnamed protein product [Urochloa humidicola]